MDLGESSGIESDPSTVASIQHGTGPGPAATELDLDAIEQDLADVETALARLEAGTYWTCEVTGRPLSDEHLANHPTARRLPSA